MIVLVLSEAPLDVVFLPGMNAPSLGFIYFLCQLLQLHIHQFLDIGHHLLLRILIFSPTFLKVS